MTSYEIAVAATRGARDYQEDSTAVWTVGQSAGFDDRPAADHVGTSFAVLADGMGGHAGGALASRIVCDNFLHHVVQAGAASITERLRSALDAANDAVAAHVSDRPQLDGMGATVIGAAFSGAGLEWVSVGDSPLYLYRFGAVEAINADHSLAPVLDTMVAEGRMSEAEARRDPRRHMLRSAVTGEEIDMIDVSTTPIKLHAGDVVVLASDGVDTLDKVEIARIISGYAADGVDAVAHAIIRAVEAMREPFQDNATVIVVRPSMADSITI